MICIVYMCYWTKKITVLNIVNVLEEHKASLYDIVVAQHPIAHHYNF